MCETTSRGTFHRRYGCILLIAWKAHSSIQHITAGNHPPPHGASTYSGSWPITGLRDHTHTLDTQHSVGLLWTSDQPDAETAIWQHTTFTTARHSCPGEIRTRAATGIGLQLICSQHLLLDWLYLRNPRFAANTTSLSQRGIYQHTWLRQFVSDHRNVIFCYWHKSA